MKSKEQLIKQVQNKVYYARNSYSIRLMYQAKGYLDALVECGAVEYDDVRELYIFILRDCINNGAWLTEIDRREKADLDNITYE